MATTSPVAQTLSILIALPVIRSAILRAREWIDFRDYLAARKRRRQGDR